MTDTVATAHEAFERYTAFYEEGRLVQSDWRTTDDDDRVLACALGVLGQDVESSNDCPAAVMPRWLAQIVVHLFDRQLFDDACDWGLRFYKALDRLDGNVPFSVVHDWHATVVTVLGIEAAQKSGSDLKPHEALQALHRRALAGEIIDVSEWRTVLRNADAYANAYAYAYANAYAYAYADADAYANAYADADAYANTLAWKRLADGMIDALNRVEVAA